MANANEFPSKKRERQSMTRGFSMALGAAFAVVVAATPALAADAAAGEDVFKKRCVACHTVEAGKNKVGPSLFGVFGRQAGAEPKFKFSDSYVEAGKKGLKWTDDKIIEYLADPKEFMVKATADPKAKSKMVFKLADETERRNVTAYLAKMK